jgi:hypothetical protein
MADPAAKGSPDNRETRRMPKVPFRSLCVIVGGAAALAACGGTSDTGNAATPSPAPIAPAIAPLGGLGEAGGNKFSLSDGPDVCFRAVAKQLGAGAKVSELTSFFSVGKDIDPSASAPAGEMTTCTVQYQNPQDPRKLLEISMDTKAGTFGQPRPVEITVMGGDASKFNLEEHLIALSQVNAAGLKAVMDGQKASMDQVFGKHAWSGVRLEAPGAFDPKHTLRLDIDGRLASNDIKEGGYASVSTDGTTIRRNLLKP